MATDLERLIVQLEARTAAFEKAMNRANGVAQRNGKRIENTVSRMNRNVGAEFTALGRTVIAAFAGAAFVRGAVRLSEAATRIDNALKVAGLSGEELEKVYGRLRDSAVKNAAPLEALVELYGRAALVQKELGVTGEELLGFTDKIALALRVSGKSAAESSGALLQLSQALGSGTVRAEEFNSILEGALPIAQAAAAGLKEAGGSVATLRQLVVDGEVSSEAFFRAFEAGSIVLEEKVQGATLTLSQAMGNLETALIDAAREFNTSTGASQRFAEGINTAAEAISDFDVSGFISKIQEAGGVLETFLNNLANSSVIERFAEAVTGLNITVGQPLDLETVEAEKDLNSLERQIQILKDRIEANKEMAIDTSEAESQLATLLTQANAVRAALAGVGSMSGQNYQPGTPGDPNALAQKVGGLAPPPKVKPVSLSDFAAPPKKGGGSKGGKAKGSSGESEYQREIEQIKERTAAIQAETAAMAGLNPLIDDYGYALTKAKAEHELLVAAEKSGLQITPQLREQISQLAAAYATASVEADKLEDEQQKLKQSAEEWNDFSKDLLGGFISDLRNGVEATEALSNALGKVADKLLDIALNSLFKSGGGFGGIGGFLAGIFKGFAGGGYTGAGGKHQPAGVVHKGEYVFSKSATQRIGVGNLEAMHQGARGYAAGGLVSPAALSPSRSQRSDGALHVTVGVSADSNGNLMPFVESVAQRTVRGAAPSIVRASVVQSTKNVRSGMPGLLAETQMRVL